MKRILYLTLLILISSNINAQDIENNNKNIKINIDELNIPDGYLLDMKDILLAPPTLMVPSYDIKSYNMEKKMNESLYFRNKFQYGQVNINTFSSRLNYWGMGNNITLNSSTYQFKNGMKLTTFGEYDADGHKRYNPSALPWQRNNFNGAFEMKTRNGNFGIRVEVQRGRETPY